MVFTRAPRYLEMYRQILGPNNVVGEGSEAPRGLDLDVLTGCPDDALLAIAEGASLANWKVTARATGSLGIRELVRQADAAAQRIRYGGSGTPQETAPAPDLSASREPTARASQVSVEQDAAMGEAGLASSERTHVLVGEVFRHAAQIYLHTVVNDAYPGTQCSPRPQLERRD